MVRLVPDSLFGRITLVLLSGLILAQVGSALISAQESRHLLRTSDEQQWTERLAGTVRLMNSLPRQARSNVRGTIDTRRLAVHLAPEISTGHDQALTHAQENLARILGPDFTVLAHGAAGEGSVRYQVQLHDGQWLVMDLRLRSELSLPQELFWRLLVLAGAALVLTLLATRVALNPLRQFTEAVKCLGSNLESPPLPLTGSRETREVAQALNTMQEKIRTSLEERTRLLAAISHDLRTPLTRLRLQAEFIEEAHELRDVLLKEVDTMQAMLRGTLDFLRGGQGESVRNLDIDALVEGVASDFSQLDTRVTVVGVAQSPFPGRSLALKRAMNNLLENAKSYGGGNVTIVICDNKDVLTINVEDDGPGIPEEEQSRVLEPFQRIETSRNAETGGQGLGLSIAQSIARAHGGDLVLGKSAAGGLSARLLLPRLPAQSS